jgi:hypothetical protein
MLFRTFASLSIVAMLAGCAAQPPITQSESIASQSPIATLVIPAPELSGGPAPSGPQDLALKVRFKNYRYMGSGEYPDVESLQWKVQGGTFTVEKYKAFYSRSSGRYRNKVSVSYDGTVGMTKAGDSYQLTFSLSKKTYYAEPSVVDGKARYQVVFPPSHIVTNLAMAEMPWTFEVNSEFNTDSTYANFARLTRKEVFRGNGEKDPVTGKIFTERFWVRVWGREIPVNVETYPYRNGSKTIIFAVLPGTVSGSTVDFTSTAEALKKEIERIIKS